MKRLIALALTILVVVTLAGCGSSPQASASGKKLVGLFRLAPGTAKGDKVTGTWFRMVQVGGTTTSGPFMANANSGAEHGTVTLLQPGTSGGLRSGAYQTQPKPAFAPNGNSLATAITKPTKFFAVAFSISTNPVDPQTKTPVVAPTVYDDNGKLTANLSSWAASWNNQNFNQGAPKPVSSTGAKAPGQQKVTKVWDWVSGTYLNAAAPASTHGAQATGTYDAKTGAFTLQWTSLIVGGPFNGFTGLWHLEGTFVPAAAAPSGA